MLKSQGEYEEALIVFQEYRQKEPTDPRGEIGVESTRNAIEWMKQPSRYQVDNLSALNSQAMDFAPVIAGKRADDVTIIFTSTREESVGKKQNGWTGGDFADLYISEAERKTSGRRGRGKVDPNAVESPVDYKWSTPALLDEGMINTESDDGSAVFDSRRKELYFTRCMYEKNKKFECGIYLTEKVGTTWRAPERIIVGGDTLANIGQPALSTDDKTLYFVSTAFGAKGHDIFMTTYDRRTKMWKTPTNLGPKVNTTGAEYYPFVHDDGYLYFASDGLPGMGGLDVFKIKLGDDGLPAAGVEAENMQFPINTSADDFALVFQPGGDKVGFMSSNRQGSKMDDLYAVVKTPLVFNIQGTVTSTKTKAPLDQVTVKLDGSDGSSFVVNTDIKGNYLFDKTQVKPDVTYKLTFEKSKFLSNTGDVTTVGVDLSSFEFIPSENVFLEVIELSKGLDPIEVPIVLPNVFFDLAKWDLRPEARAALDSVVPLLNNNPTIVIELRSHTDYRGDNKSNDILSQKRADTCVKYLISKGIDSARMVPRGMGETDPFQIDEDYDDYGAAELPKNVTLTEAYIKTLTVKQQEVANQINRRTDIKVLRDDYVPNKPKVAAGGKEVKKEDPKNPEGKIYIVQGRQSLGVIAKSEGISIVDLKKLNGGLRGVRPFEGMQLKVTVDGDYEYWDATHYQVRRANQSLKDIAKELGLDDKELEELNPEIDKKNVPLGYWVRTE